MTSLASRPWVVVENIFFAKALSASGGPDRATPSPQANSPRNQSLDTNPVCLPTIYWPNRGNLKHTSYTTCVPAGTWIEHEPPSSTRVDASGRQDSLVPRELGATNPRPVGVVDSCRVSAATELLARETQRQIPTEWEGARLAPRGSSETGRQGCCPPDIGTRSPCHQPSVCHSQEWGGLEVNNTFKIPQCIYDTSTFQDGGIIHATQQTMVKLDLKDAYLTVPIAKEYWSLLAFQVHSYTLMQFRCLPFGLCTAPFVFSKVTKPIAQFLRQLGIHLIVYLDDLLLAAPSKDLLLQNLSTVIWLFISLGFLINIPKSVTTPSHCLEVLGFMVDTESITISLPIHKVQAIQKVAAQLLHQEPIIVKDLAQMIGVLVATKPAVHTGALHYRALQDLKIQALRRHPSYQKPAQLTQEAKSDLQWWIVSLPLHCLNPIVKPEATLTIESDASNSGWGKTCHRVRTGGRWTSLEVQEHINYLELKAAFLALQSFLKGRSNMAVLIRSDNRTAIAYLNKMGSPTRSHLCLLSLEIWEWSLEHHIMPHAEYLAGKDNIIADWESRHHDSSDWQLLPSVFEAINNLLGLFTIDLFASRTNAQLPVYYSWKPDPQARMVDAFSISWLQECPYMFPPFSMIGKTLMKICQEELKFACLIAPAWPAQVWYPQLLKMLVRNPVLLPLEQDLLLDPLLNPHPLVLEGRMFLTAWPVSGKPMLPRDFLAESPNCCCSHEDQILTHLTTQPGLSGVAGVLNDKYIHFQHL